MRTAPHAGVAANGGALQNQKVERATMPSAMNATAPCSEKSESLPLYSTPARALVMLRVGNNPPVPVVFDTGTSGNIIDRKLAERYGLHRNGPSSAFDGALGKPVPGFETTISGASLGGVAIAEGPANAIDYDLPDEVGVFGPGSFAGCLVQMNLAAGRITIEPKNSATVPAGMALAYNGTGDDALPSIELHFANQTVIAELDTGNNAELLLPLSMAKTLPLEAPPIQTGWSNSAAGRQPAYTAILKGQVRIGPVVLDHPLLTFNKGGRPNAGLPIARQVVVVFDPAEHRDWIIARSTGSAVQTASAASKTTSTAEAKAAVATEYVARSRQSGSR